MAIGEKGLSIKERFTEKKALDFVDAYPSDQLFEFVSKEKICFYLKLKHVFLGLFLIFLVTSVVFIFANFSFVLKVSISVLVFLFFFAFLFLSKKHERAEALTSISWNNANKLIWFGLMECVYPYVDASIQRQINKILNGFYSPDEFKTTYEQIREYVLKSYPFIKKTIERKEQEILLLEKKSFQEHSSTLQVTEEMRVHWQINQPFAKSFHDNALQKNSRQKRNVIPPKNERS